MENKEKTPRNDRGQLHGYVEIYDYKTNELSVRGYSYNGDDVGYNEYHQFNKVVYNIR